MRGSTARGTKACGLFSNGNVRGLDPKDSQQKITKGEKNRSKLQVDLVPVSGLDHKRIRAYGLIGKQTSDLVPRCSLSVSILGGARLEAGYLYQLALEICHGSFCRDASFQCGMNGGEVGARDVRIMFAGNG